MHVGGDTKAQEVVQEEMATEETEYKDINQKEIEGERNKTESKRARKMEQRAFAMKTENKCMAVTQPARAGKRTT